METKLKCNVNFYEKMGNLQYTKQYINKKLLVNNLKLSNLIDDKIEKYIKDNINEFIRTDFKIINGYNSRQYTLKNPEFTKSEIIFRINDMDIYLVVNWEIKI